jgi:hypothetical protein
MRDFSALSDGAARLLLHYLDADGETQEPEEQQRLAGISRATLYRARTQLIERGYIDRRGNLRWVPATPAPAAPTPVEIPRPPSLVEPERASSDVLSDLEAGYITPRQACMQVDALPWSGDPQELMRGGSPAQKRKQQQVAVVQAVLKRLSNLDLSNRDAKSLLTATNESAEDALDLIEEMQRRVRDKGLKLDAPGRYLLKMATNTQVARPATRAAAPQVRPVAVGAPEREDVDQGTMLSDWTPETKRKMARLEKLGLLRTRSEDE